MKPTLTIIATGVLAAATILASTSSRAEATAKKDVKLEPAVLYTLRDGLPNLAAKLKAGGEVNVLFLGGSITVGGASPKGYVTFVGNWLKEHYPNAKINIINAGVSGTGSDYGDRRYERDVLPIKPDLVLIEFCVNDGDNDRTESMERMVHKTWLNNPHADLLIFYTMMKPNLDYYKQGKLPPSASAHERVAAFYGIPSLCTVYNAAAQINSGEAPWEKFSGDGCHPTQDGYVYFNDVFAQALPELLKDAPAKTHELGKSITPNLVVFRPPCVAKPVEFQGDLITAKGEKAQKVYPLPIPSKNWTGEPVFSGPDGKPLWRLSWLPRELGGKLDPSIGSDKSQWETNSMVWFEGDGGFTGPLGSKLFGAHGDRAVLAAIGKEIGLIRFIAPETGRYVIKVNSGPWSTNTGDGDKSMSLSVLKFSWNGGPGESIGFQKEIKKESKGLSIEIETKLLAGEEVAFIPDTENQSWYFGWPALTITVGFLGE
ncbi:MAG: SGNH/GDSL hydrolase family protein [Verrucomicrobiae bacterium]